MSFEIDGVSYFTLREVAELAGKSKQTIERWYKTKKIPMPDQMQSNGWRVYSEETTKKIVGFAKGIRRAEVQTEFDLD